MFDFPYGQIFINVRLLDSTFPTLANSIVMVPPYIAGPNRNVSKAYLFVIRQKYVYETQQPEFYPNPRSNLCKRFVGCPAAEVAIAALAKTTHVHSSFFFLTTNQHASTLFRLTHW